MRKNHQILSTNSNANYQLSLGSLSSNWLRKHVSGDRESETYDRLWMHLLIGFLGSSWAYIVFFNVALRGCILTQTSHMVMGSKTFLIGQKSWWTSWWANVKVPKTCTTRWRGLVSWHCLSPGLNFQGVMHVEDLTCQGLRVCVCSSQDVHFTIWEAAYSSTMFATGDSCTVQYIQTHGLTFILQDELCTTTCSLTYCCFPLWAVVSVAR